MRKAILLFIIIQSNLLLINCSEKKKLEISILNDEISKTLFFTITNLDDMPYFISKNSWLTSKGDTLFVDAVYMPSNDSSARILFNQFNPPELEALNPNSKIFKRISYKDLRIDIGKISAIRIFDSLYPYDPNSENVKYHSIDAFYDFQNRSSFLLAERNSIIDSAANW